MWRFALYIIFIDSWDDTTSCIPAKPNEENIHEQSLCPCKASLKHFGKIFWNKAYSREWTYEPDDNDAEVENEYVEPVSSRVEAAVAELLHALLGYYYAHQHEYQRVTRKRQQTPLTEQEKLLHLRVQ